MLVTVLAAFFHEHPLSFNISAGHQDPKDVTNIEILSLTSKNCQQDKVANIYVALDKYRWTNQEVGKLYVEKVKNVVGFLQLLCNLNFSTTSISN